MEIYCGYSDAYFNAYSISSIGALNSNGNKYRHKNKLILLKRYCELRAHRSYELMRKTPEGHLPSYKPSEQSFKADIAHMRHYAMWMALAKRAGMYYEDIQELSAIRSKLSNL